MSTLRTLFICLGTIIFISACSHPQSKPNIQAHINVYKLINPPSVGQTSTKQNIVIGGLSALQFERNENGVLYFWSITDRGPNALDFLNLKNIGPHARPFLLPEFSPLLVKISLNPKEDIFKVENIQNFKLKNGQNITGRPPQGTKHLQQEIPIDIYGKRLLNDKQGLDSEGFCSINNNFYVTDEYRPGLFKFDSKLKLVQIWKPKKSLPKALSLRKLNRGLEGLACSKQFAYLMMQSPIKSTYKNDNDFIRIIKFDLIKNKTVQEYFYPIKSEIADKIGDISLISEDQLLVVEQNGILGSQKGIRNIYRIDLTQADKEFKLSKHLVLNLNEVGFDYVEKIEGISLINRKTIALITDNDFSLNGEVNLKIGQIDIQNKPSYLAIIELAQELY